MLAYVFWHVPKSTAVQSEYEARLKAFHQALRIQPPKGLITSISAHLLSIPWLDDDAGYEDWYILTDSAALDVLEKQSVTGPLEQSHHAIASQAAKGVAGLYKPIDDDITAFSSATSVWFSKPEGVSYASLFSRLKKIEPNIPSFLWQRKLTLGPTPEFCLLGKGPDLLPYGWSSTLLVRRPVFN